MTKTTAGTRILLGILFTFFSYQRTMKKKTKISQSSVFFLALKAPNRKKNTISTGGQIPKPPKRYFVLQFINTYL